MGPCTYLLVFTIIISTSICIYVYQVTEKLIISASQGTVLKRLPYHIDRYKKHKNFRTLHLCLIAI